MTLAITHFDGDPFVTELWLRLYSRFWRGEVDGIRADFCYNPAIVPPALVAWQLDMFAGFPEIKLNVVPFPKIPELTNNELLPQALVDADKVMLIETDGFIFGRNIVAFCFANLNTVDLVAAPHQVIPYQLRPELGTDGYMRNCFFARRSALSGLELDFMPRTLPAGMVVKPGGAPLAESVDCDCFGWISVQLAARNLKTTWTPANCMDYDSRFDASRYDQFPWLHVRQMNSSVLGFGCPQYKQFRDGDTKAIAALRKTVKDSPAAIWQYEKALAFRMLMVETIQAVPPEAQDFYAEYNNVLRRVMHQLKINYPNVIELKSYYRGLMRL